MTDRLIVDAVDHALLRARQAGHAPMLITLPQTHYKHLQQACRAVDIDGPFGFENLYRGVPTRHLGYRGPPVVWIEPANAPGQRQPLPILWPANCD